MIFNELETGATASTVKTLDSFALVSASSCGEK